MELEATELCTSRSVTDAIIASGGSSFRNNSSMSGTFVLSIAIVKNRGESGRFLKMYPCVCKITIPLRTVVENLKEDYFVRNLRVRKFLEFF